MQKKLYRSKTNRTLLGVCAGIAEYFDVDPTLIRVICGVCSALHFPLIIAYFVCALVIPEKPDGNIVDAD